MDCWLRNTKQMVNRYFLMIFFAILSIGGAYGQENSLLFQLADTLNEEFSELDGMHSRMRFYVHENNPVNFFVFDLIDTTNNSENDRGFIEFKDPGIYHFSPTRYRYSYSHIAILHNGKLKIFSYLNCDENGETVEKVLTYIERYLSLEKEALDRIRRYRSYGHYVLRDPMEKSSGILCPN